MSSAKWPPLCQGLNVVKHVDQIITSTSPLVWMQFLNDFIVYTIYVANNKKMSDRLIGSVGPN